MKIFALIVGIGYVYLLFMFIPMRKKKDGEALESGYYKGAIKQFLIYVVAYFAYTYFYDWLKNFFIK